MGRFWQDCLRRVVTEWCRNHALCIPPPRCSRCADDGDAWRQLWLRTATRLVRILGHGKGRDSAREAVRDRQGPSRSRDQKGLPNIPQIAQPLTAGRSDPRTAFAAHPVSRSWRRCRGLGWSNARSPRTRNSRCIGYAKCGGAC